MLPTGGGENGGKYFISLKIFGCQIPRPDCCLRPVSGVWAGRRVRSVAPLSAAGSDSDDTEIVDLSGAGTGAGLGAGQGAGRPKTAFQALNSRFSLVLAELRQVHLRTMKPASLPPLASTGDRWISINILLD